MTRKGKASWSPWLIPAVGLGTIFLFWGVARVTGYWHSYLTADQLAEAYRQAREPPTRKLAQDTLPLPPRLGPRVSR